MPVPVPVPVPDEMISGRDRGSDTYSGRYSGSMIASWLFLGRWVVAVLTVVPYFGGPFDSLGGAPSLRVTRVGATLGR